MNISHSSESAHAIEKLAKEIDLVSARKRTEDFVLLYELNEKLAELERARAISNSREAAVGIEWSLAWNSYPKLTVFASELELEIQYYIRRPEAANRNRASVRFLKYRAIQQTNVNDEIFSSQKLAHSGLRPMRAHVVQNSEWLRSLRDRHQTHHNFDMRYWLEAKHFLLTFKDCTFECIADDFEQNIL